MGARAIRATGFGYLCIGLVDLAIVAVLLDSGRWLALLFALLFGGSVGIAGVAVLRTNAQTRALAFGSKGVSERSAIVRIVLVAFPLSLAGVGALWWLFHRVSDEAAIALDLGAVSAGIACGFFLGFGVMYLAASRLRLRDEPT